MADLKKKFKMQTEQLKQAKELKKKIDDDIKKDSKDIEGFFKRRRYIKQRANDYDEICRLYGRKVYVKAVPDKIRQNSLYNSLNQGKYIDVLDIHGERKFNSNLPQIIKNDITYESDNWRQRLTGMIKKVLPLKAKKISKDVIGTIGVTTILLPAAFLTTNAEITKHKEAKEYKVQISEYLDDIEKYGDETKTLNLTPLQTMMKITEDMWSRIEGYGDPQIDLQEYAGLDVSKEMGVGVCRNMADDCSRRLNAINKDYNARVITVYAEKGEYVRSDIPPKIANNPDSIEEQDSSNKEEAPIVDGSNLSGNTSSKEETNLISINVGGKELLSVSEKDIDNFIDTKIVPRTGNHAVVLVDIKEDDVTLVLDPTNAGVGLFYNGKITMFNSMGQAHPLEMRVAPAGNLVYGLGKAFIEMPDSLLDSLGIYTEEELEQLNNKYGVVAQNNALDQIRKMNKSAYIEDLKVDGSYTVNIEIGSDKAKQKNNTIDDATKEIDNDDKEM